jgi:hypothetical protein
LAVFSFVKAYLTSQASFKQLQHEAQAVSFMLILFFASVAGKKNLAARPRLVI